MATLSTQSESWPIRGNFAISRGSKNSAEVVVVELRDGEHAGRGECVPYARYGESCDSVIDAIESLRSDISNELDRQQLQQRLPAGAARNAIDCALWDLQASRSQKRSWQIAGLPKPHPEITAYTLSLGTPEAMRESARGNSDRPLLKLKLAGPGDLDRVVAVREGAPEARLIVDANEGWTPEIYQSLAPELDKLGVEMIEQPLPAGKDAALLTMDRPVPVCADESCHDRQSLDNIAGKYDMINIKLDKTGGLTEALALRKAAEDAGLEIMVGCMLATSLAMAPALLVAQGVKVVDLDGPLLLQGDRPHGLRFEGSVVYPSEAMLWA